MKKRCMNYEKDFNTDCKVYDCNVRDYFGNKFYIVHNETLNSIRFMSKNKEYKKDRNHFDKMNLKHVIVLKWLNVIDVRIETYNQIQTFFSGVNLPCKEFLNIW